MGQSFLSHDEKSSGSPSPDLLRFSGGQSNPKFFGSLSSVKETSTSGSCRSPCDSTDSEKSLLVASASSSPRSPILLPAGSEDDNGTAVDNDAPRKSSLYESLVPTPISPGNVSRLRKKFMEFDRKGSAQNERNNDKIDKNSSYRRKEVSLELDCRYNSGENATSPNTNSSTVGRRMRGGTLPTLPPPLSSPRSRSSLYTLSPSSYQNRHHYRTLNRISRTLPSTPASFSARLACDKSDGIRSANDLSECFRQMTLNSTGDNFTNENPVGRQRPRTRPNVPPPRSVIIKAGYLPTVQKVNLISNRGESWTSVLPNYKSREGTQERAAASIPSKSHSGSSIPGERDLIKIEDRKLGSSASAPLGPHSLVEPPEKRVVTKQEDHTEKVLKKDAEVNTSAEVLVLPKGTKTSVVLKSVLMDEVDGKVSKKGRRKKKKRGIRRVARVFGRVMIRLVELF